MKQIGLQVQLIGKVWMEYSSGKSTGAGQNKTTLTVECNDKVMFDFDVYSVQRLLPSPLLLQYPCFGKSQIFFRRNPLAL